MTTPPRRPDPDPTAPLPTSRPPILGLLVTIAVLIAAALGIAQVTGSSDDGNGHRTVTIDLGAPASPGAVKTTPTSVEVPASAVAQARSDAEDRDLKGEQPLGVSHDELANLAEQLDKLATTDALPIVTPDAAPSQYGCTTRLVRNYSSRRGVRPRLLVAHYTVSPNRPGWSDVWGNVALFNAPAFAASSNYVIDGEGHCAYIVRESDKAWTQAAANPFAISAELINSGHEPALLASPGLAKVGRVFADAAKRWAIPLQLGKVSGCTVVRPGIIDHHALGACGGGHVDVSPYSVQTVIRAATLSARSRGQGARVGAAPNTATERRRCGQLRHHRVAVRQHRGKWSDHLKVGKTATIRSRRARYLKGALTRAGVAEARCK
jgi:hypothetical protein